MAQTIGPDDARAAARRGRVVKAARPPMLNEQIDIGQHGASLIEYIGPSDMPVSFEIGRGDGATTYIFSNRQQHRMRLIDKRHADYLLGLAPNGEKIFREIAAYCPGDKISQAEPEIKIVAGIDATDDLPSGFAPQENSEFGGHQTSCGDDSKLQNSRAN